MAGRRKAEDSQGKIGMLLVNFARSDLDATAIECGFIASISSSDLRRGTVENLTGSRDGYHTVLQRLRHQAHEVDMQKPVL